MKPKGRTLLLAIDVGNTNITFGLFKGRRLIRQWRAPTRNAPSPCWFLPCLPKHKVDGVIVSSVVPELDSSLRTAVKKRYGQKPVFVDHKNAGVKIAYPRPKEIGADRLVNAAAALKKYHPPFIIVDFGTATTFDYIDRRGRYLGGPIAPGIKTAAKILYDAASKLPEVKVVRTTRMLPNSTAAAIQTGIYQGYIGLIERLIKLTAKESGCRPKIIATGGLATLVAKGTSLIKKIAPSLTLEGLQIIWDSLEEAH